MMFDNLDRSNEEIIAEIELVTGKRHSEEQLQILRAKGGLNIIACAGSGKALKNGTGVLTPNGYVPIEKLKVGDKCYAEDGMEQTVTGVFPQGKKEIYDVEFSDDTVIPCCKDHLWTYQTYNMRRTTKKWKTDTLENILNNIPISVYPHTNRNGETQNRANIYIPMTRAVEFESKDLPIKPYTLGALLGDGCLKGISDNCNYGFSNLDEDVVKRVDLELHGVDAYLKDKGDNANYRINVGNGYGYKGTEGLFTQKIKELGLLGKGSHTKFIPNVYKYSSVEDRLDLIKGLIDTDGHCNGTSYEITLMSEELIDDIKFIIETLGMTAVKCEKEVTCKTEKYNSTGVGYRLYIKTSDEIPKIHWSRHREGQWKSGQTSARRTITNITKTGEFAEMTCIKVSSPSELFLTEYCVVTHNTTMLTHLIAKRIKSGEIANPSKLLCTTYSKAGADEMSTRLNKLLKKLNVSTKVTVKTIHASYYHVLKYFGLMKNICTNGQRKMFIKEACTDIKIRLEEEDMNTLDSLLSYQINNLMTDKDLVNSYIYTLENVSEAQYSAIRKAYNKKKEENDLIDFDDMQLYMYNLLVVQKNEMVLSYCKSLWEYFYIDEFQDTSKIQFAIIRTMATDPNKIMVIGDDDQCVYRWRGADPTIILNICGYYDIEKFFLITNYRCGGNIVKIAEAGVKNLSRRENKSMQFVNEGGKIDILTSNGGNLFNLSMDTYKHIKREMARGAKASEICVLARNNNHVAILGNMLLHDGIYCESADDMKISKMSLFKDLVGVIEMSRDTYNANLVKSTLWKMAQFLGMNGANAVYQFMQATGCSLKNSLGYILTNYGHRNDVSWGGKVKIADRVSFKIEAMYDRVNYKAVDGLVTMYNVLCSEDEAMKLRAFFFMYKEGAAFMYGTKDRRRTLSGMVQYFAHMCETYGVEDTEAFFRLTEQYESGKMAVTGDKITLSTIHGSKGMEWKYVIQFADDNTSFPSFEGMQGMIKKGISEADIYNTIDDERRLHYVAQTRAIKKWTLVADIGDISVLALESIGIIPNRGGNENNALILRLANMGGLSNSIKCAIIEELGKGDSPYAYSYKEEVEAETLKNKITEDAEDAGGCTSSDDDLSDGFTTGYYDRADEENEFWGM